MTGSPGDVCLRRGCSACCHDTRMPLTGEDVARLEARGFDRDVFSFVNPEGHRQLRTVEAEGRPCVFLRAGRCGVYEDRPAGCRVYPFVLTPEGRVVRDEDCPHRGEFPADPSARRRLLRIVAVLERETGTRLL